VTRQERVIWHDVECGGYGADLPLWRELADECGGRVLEIGCGTGRVALDLARRGHPVTGVDTDAQLVAALRERAGGLGVRAEVADARTLDLPAEFALVAAPMQVLQLFRQPADREAALATAARCLAPGGLVAASIVEGVPGGGGAMAQVLPDVAEVDGWVYSSLPLEITDEGGWMRVRRLRQVVAPAGDLTEAVDQTRLAVLDASALEGEAGAAGLRPAGRRAIPDTDAHVGSVVVLLRRDVG
jgi:SAM-dependent methyltransferase